MNKIVSVDYARPIETRYKGYRFRSRLEARWAVYFDGIKLKWEYEKEGFILPSGIHYLPDFWLPQVQMWAEVKPDFKESYFDVLDELARATGFNALLLDGLPRLANWWGNYVVDYLPADSSDPCAFRCDYIIGYHEYHLTEGRFYASTGEEFPDRCEGGDEEAIDQALSARFEFGESGAS